MIFRSRASPKELADFCGLVSLQLAAGKDCLSAIKSVRQRAPKFVKSLSHEIELLSFETAVRARVLRSKSFEEIFVLESLLAGLKSQIHLKELLDSLAQCFYRLHYYEKKQRSLLKLPRLQAIILLFMSLFISFVVPIIFSNSLISFLDLGLRAVFWTLCALILAGSCLSLWICEYPQIKYKPKIKYCHFLFYLSRLLQAGTDFRSAWNRSLEVVHLAPSDSKLLQIPMKTAKALTEHLQEIEQLNLPIQHIISPLQICIQSGKGLISVIESASLRLFDDICMDWEEEAQQRSLTSLLPLGFLVLPSTLTLLLGPQFLYFQMRLQ
ncbi:MAG: hypothetical protein COV44_01295 [Deltaproteobacteria bacterium CG11_big_fil_rev_8_21_14_0_20_45_16]|nr:MAG: hypothetical protein COV44_01295 [Deltaproteobacteria bacterium CG11_big_fil_rev_8_21_14_0_20_45_16]